MVQWKGYTAEKDTWKNKENLKNAMELVKEFKKEYSYHELSSLSKSIFIFFSFSFSFNYVI